MSIEIKFHEDKKNLNSIGEYIECATCFESIYKDESYYDCKTIVGLEGEEDDDSEYTQCESCHANKYIPN